MYNLQNTFSVFDAVYTFSAHNFISQALIRMYIQSMVAWVVDFSRRGTKLEIFLSKNQHTQRKLLNFENWVNGEVSKIGHHFRK